MGNPRIFTVPTLQTYLVALSKERIEKEIEMNFIEAMVLNQEVQNDNNNTTEIFC